MLRIVPLLVLLVFVAACGNGAETPSPEETPQEETGIPFRKDGELTFLRDGEPYLTINLEIADTDSLRERGLMQRTSMPDRSGMLFLFDQQQIHSFWMNNTLISLDFAFIGPDSTIVDTQKYAKPLGEDPITAAVPSLHVLELPAGTIDTYGIIETDRVTWERMEE